VVDIKHTVILNKEDVLKAIVMYMNSLGYTVEAYQFLIRKAVTYDGVFFKSYEPVFDGVKLTVTK
jgi:hypothetical protein